MGRVDQKLLIPFGGVNRGDDSCDKLAEFGLGGGTSHDKEEAVLATRPLFSLEYGPVIVQYMASA